MSGNLNHFESSRFTCVTVAIADEDPVYRKDLRELLSAQQSIEIIGEAYDAESADLLLARLAPQVLLLDYPLCQKLHGRSARNQESGTQSVLKVVMLAAPEKTKIIESFRLGAVGIVLKGTAQPIWWSSIAAVVAGEYWLGSESLAVLIQAIRESASHGGGAVSARHFGLTPREIEIVQKIADGRSNKEVGHDFSIREQTVKHHLTNIFGKVGVSSRLELALFARDHKILSMPGHAEGASAAEHQDAWLRPEKGQPEASRPEIVRELKKRTKNA